MKIIIPTIGSRGDVQPFIALAQGLVWVDHEVILASHPVMKDLVEAYGVAFAPIGPDIDLALRVATIRQQARNPAIGLMRAMQFGFEMLERSHDDLMTLCHEADLVVVPTAVAAGKNEAELLNIPYLSVTLMPWAIPWSDPDRPIIKRLLYSAIDGLVALITTRPLNRLRKRLGLPPVGSEGFTSKQLNLVPVSPSVYPPNPMWEPRHRVVGYWFSAEPEEWEPPADLLSFLEKGEPPILISLGAMSLGEGDALESASLFVDAIQQIGVRAIIQGWDAVIEQLLLPESIYHASSIPHGWLLAHCAAIVHHGGFGTTAAGLRAGIPALIIPHVADQFYWGQQVFDLGVGLKPIPRSKLNIEGLTTSLDELIRDEKLQTAATNLGERIRTENGVENGVRLIEETFL